MSSEAAMTNFTPGGGDDPRNPFHYMPSMAAAIVSLVFYSLSFIALSALTIWKRSWYMIPLLVGCLMEVIGYATRIPLAITPVGHLSLYIVMSAFIVIAPVFNAAVAYMLFGRLVLAVGNQYSLIKPKVVTWIFLTFDIISFLIQSSGAGLLSSAGENPEKAKLGENILLGGLGINLISFAIFCLQIFYFDYHTRKSLTVVPGGGLRQKGWRQFLYVIYFSSLLVLIRQIYRVIEFAQGFTGYLAVHELYFYIFDTVLIFVAGAIFIVFFPGNGYLPRNSKDTFSSLEGDELNLKGETY